MNNMILTIIIESLLLALSVFFLYRFYVKNRQYTQKYSGLIDADQELQKTTEEKNKVTSEIEVLRESYREKKLIYDKLLKNVAIFDEEIELAEFGFYKPHFDFDTSEKYKEKIKESKEKQKLMLKEKSAIYCETEWTVDGNKSAGKTMINRAIRLTARAFNNECDAAISNISWNNAEKMELRIEKAFEAINKSNESNKIVISSDFLNLKIEEMRLTHEYKEKKQKEKEKQAEDRRKRQEDAKFDEDKEKALKEENRYQALLDKAKAEAEKATGDKLESLKRKIDSLSIELEEAHSRSERAKSMAEQTKIGHVYVISNIGSFGENVYKIGMTRRLEPLDRVKELGDASVPFSFDVHAIIYTEDAPALESSLHKVFDKQRLNLVNSRKEFFHTTLDEIEAEVVKISPDAEFVKIAEAQEFHETQAIRHQEADTNEVNEEYKVPDEI